MNVVFVHYHLNAGGVTQVIVNQLRALAELRGDERPQRVGVLYGGRHEGWPEKVWGRIEDGSLVPFDEVLIPLLSIDYDQLPTLREDQLADEVTAALVSHGFGPDGTLLHVHNHSLGKNVSWPGAIQRLAKRGYRLLLQVHDFVEDFRPANYRLLARAWDISDPRAIAERQYPLGAGVHYATLTDRDRRLLTLAGVPGERLHNLPNAAAEFVGLRPYDQVAGKVRAELGLPADSRLVLYPVRGIRRKNLGEFLLHAAISPSDTWHAVTLAPQNPLELPSFERWRALSDLLQLRALFDTCGSGQTEFLDAVSAADATITTSVAEGFGMVFLETWLAGKSLVGRDLPDITTEFKDRGLELDRLYESLDVPLELIDQQGDLCEALQVAFEWANESYGVPIEEKWQVGRDIERLLADGQIDFALLPSRFQEQLLRTAATNTDAVRQAIFAANPGLEGKLASDGYEVATIDRNAAVVRAEYSLAQSSAQLASAYRQLFADSPNGEVEPASDGQAILHDFMQLDRLHAIRFEE